MIAEYRPPIVPLTGFSIMLDKITSGGQSGADQAAWRAAAAFAVPTGGWMPRGFLTEDGPRPEFIERYGAAESATFSAPSWIEQNAQDADATLWFGTTTTAGAQATVAACLRLARPCLPVSPGTSSEPAHVVRWLTERSVKVLNVAGNGETEEPGIGAFVEPFLSRVLEQLGHERR
jgi:hypothetical protein